MDDITDLLTAMEADRDSFFRTSRETGADRAINLQSSLQVLKFAILGDASITHEQGSSRSGRTSRTADPAPVTSGTGTVKLHPADAKLGFSDADAIFLHNFRSEMRKRGQEQLGEKLIAKAGAIIQRGGIDPDQPNAALLQELQQEVAFAGAELSGLSSGRYGRRQARWSSSLDCSDPVEYTSTSEPDEQFRCQSSHQRLGERPITRLW